MKKEMINHFKIVIKVEGNFKNIILKKILYKIILIIKKIIKITKKRITMSYLGILRKIIDKIIIIF